MRSSNTSWLSYENGTVLFTSLIIGVTTFDRLAVNFISPYLVRDLHLSNVQLGMLSAALSLAIAVVGFLVGALSDAKGWRKQLLVPALGLFAVISVFSGLSVTFLGLMVTRLAMGMVMGPINMITQSVIGSESSDHRRGLNLGMQSVIIFVAGPMLGPIVATSVAETWNWQAAFFVSTLPALALMVIVARFMRTQQQSSAIREQTVGAMPAPQRPEVRRNVRLCVLISAMFMTWLVVQNTFLPVYLVNVIHMTPTQMGWLLSVQGVAACVGGLSLPFLSDRLGRKTTLVCATLLGMVAPLGTLLVHDAPMLLAVLLFIGGLANGAMPLYAVIIPSESVAPQRLVRTIALIIGTGELCGGVVAPILSGRAADSLGADAPFWIITVAAAVSAVIALLIRETAPPRKASVSTSPAETAAP